MKEGVFIGLAMLFVTVASLFYLTRHPAQAADRQEIFSPLTASDTIHSLVQHPAFKGFGQHLLARDSDLSRPDLPLSQIQSLLPYHGFVDTKTVLAALNHMVDEAAAGRKIFYDFYADPQKREEPQKASSGLFFFRGKAGAPFAVLCPGGGFAYVGSFHEGFPFAFALSRKGYNAFVLQYRTGGERLACEDLAAALGWIFAHADELALDTRKYSLWGASAGARMAANVGSYGTEAFGGAALPRPGAVIMAYTGHSRFTKSDPPTFAVVSADDPIANPLQVERRIKALQEAGIDAFFRKYQHAGHGFGLGVGTDAEGWLDEAVRFWEKQLGSR